MIKLIGALALLMLTQFGCGTITSGTDRTKVISGDAYSVNVRVFQPARYNENIGVELNLSNSLARLHCLQFNKVSLHESVNNSLFKTMQYKCLSLEQFDALCPKKSPEKWAWNCMEAIYPPGSLTPDFYPIDIDQRLGEVDRGVNSTLTRGSSQAESQFADKKDLCVDLGFKEGTEPFGDCVLRLIEVDTAKASGGSQIEQQKQYDHIRQQNTDAQRLEGLKQMLEGVQQGIDATRPKTQRTDAACVQKCLSDGSMMSYCKSFCSY